MPQKGSNQEPPPVMTWSKALPVIIVAGIFDAIRIFFEMFWFFGPAMAAIVCAAKATEYVGASAGNLLCGAAATVGGVAISEITTPFGVVMAMAVGLFGFLTLGLWILMTNSRIFKANATGSLWFMGSLAVSEVPIVGAFPSFTVVLWKLYGTQIKAEKAALKKYLEKNADAELAERNRQTTQLIQIQTAQAAEAEQEAADDDEYTPEEVRETA